MGTTDIQKPGVQKDAQEEPLPVGRALPTDSFASLTLEKRTRVRDMASLTEVTSLDGTWTGDLSDGFEDEVRSQRGGVWGETAGLDKMCKSHIRSSH